MSQSLSPVPELTSLGLLRAVGNGGSISEAARQHGLSQPAASKRLAALERTLAVSLLQRSKTGSGLTPEGQVVADWAGRVLETVEQMFNAVAAMQGHTAADLRLVSSMTVAEHLVPGWLSSLRNIRPELHVGLRVMNSHDVQDLLLEQQADLGLIETSSWNPALASRTISRDRLAVVVPPSHPWHAVDDHSAQPGSSSVSPDPVPGKHSSGYSAPSHAPNRSSNSAPTPR